MNPRPRLCLLENVPGLRDKDKETGRSSFDAVQDAFAELGFSFVWKIFNAAATGIPNNRMRLYMAAIAGLPAEDSDALTHRVHGLLTSMLDGVAHRPLSKFLLDEYMPQGYTLEDMMKDWMPHLLQRTEKSPTNKTIQKSTKSKKSKKGKTWVDSPHAADKGRYLAHLDRNPWFQCLTLREKDVLLLELCHHPFPGPQTGVVTVHTSATFSRCTIGALPCQVPNAMFWLLGYNRLQTGAEALMLQGVDLVDIPSFGVGSHPSRFLQDLAGNAFCVYQFVVWLLACLPQVSDAA